MHKCACINTRDLVLIRIILLATNSFWVYLQKKREVSTMRVSFLADIHLCIERVSQADVVY